MLYAARASEISFGSNLLSKLSSCGSSDMIFLSTSNVAPHDAHLGRNPFNTKLKRSPPNSMSFALNGYSHPLTSDATRKYVKMLHHIKCDIVVVEFLF